MHGGRVEARSEGLGRGSEFIVELPVHQRSGAGAPPSPPPVLPFPRRRILVVDDNLDAAETLGELLTALGSVVAVVHSGRDALTEMNAFEPDTVILDIGMPGMDGYEVARRIRSAPEHHDVLLVALTGWGQEHDQRRSTAAGFDYHVVKPPDIDQLRRILVASRDETGASFKAR
jgi:CheY-like chemotaxis protein